MIVNAYQNWVIQFAQEQNDANYSPTFSPLRLWYWLSKLKCKSHQKNDL